MTMEILYSDKHVVVCIKPAGVLSQEDGENNAVALLRDAEKCDIFPVHRLDREVTGVMVFAKTQKSAAELSRQIADGRMKKEYHAVLCGVPAEETGEYRDLLFHDRAKNKSYVVSRSRRGVREAILRYRTVGCGTLDGMAVSLVNISLITGRTHQIRVQFSSRGTPLYGDRKYGGTGGAIALVSTKLAFVHPVTGKDVCCGIPLPDAPPWNAIEK